LYTGFRRNTQEAKSAYEGMVFRDVATSIETHNTFDEGWDMIHFMAFNALE